MKATGIVRRIDDLGRVVIPKEVRRSMNIREGDALEIYTTNDGICFKPYSPYREDLEFYVKGFLDGLAVKVAVYDHFGNLVCASFDKAPFRYKDGDAYYGIGARDGELYARIVPCEEVSEDTEKYFDAMANVIAKYLEMKES